MSFGDSKDPTRWEATWELDFQKTQSSGREKRMINRWVWEKIEQKPKSRQFWITIQPFISRNTPFTLFTCWNAAGSVAFEAILNGRAKEVVGVLREKRGLKRM